MWNIINRDGNINYSLYTQAIQHLHVEIQQGVVERINSSCCLMAFIVIRLVQWTGCKQRNILMPIELQLPVHGRYVIIQHQCFLYGASDSIAQSAFFIRIIRVDLKSIHIKKITRAFNRLLVTGTTQFSQIGIIVRSCLCQTFAKCCKMFKKLLSLSLTGSAFDY